MRRFWYRVFSSLLGRAALLILLAGAGAQAPHDSPAHVQLIWDGNPIRSGHKLWVGVLFQLDPGWHIYWRNPGDSGAPPKIEWKLPPNFRGGAILWPRPILLGTSSVRDYGYEGQVLLITPLQTPPNLQSPAPISIAATVKYIVCREICIPGKADLTLSVPLHGQSVTGQSPWRELFQKTRALLPAAPPPDWIVSATLEGDNFVLTLRGGSAEEMRFFPLEPGVIENAAPQTLSAVQNGLRLTLKKSDQLLKPVPALKGVIVLDKDRAYEIAVPVKSS